MPIFPIRTRSDSLTDPWELNLRRAAFVGRVERASPKKNMASIDTANLSIRDVFTTRHGAKIVSIKDGDCDLVFQPNEYLRVPFEPSTFADSESQRLNLVIETTRPILEEFARLDEWFIEHIADHSERLLKKRLTFDQVWANYSSCVRTSARGYPATLKTKVDVGVGRYAVVLGRRRQAAGYTRVLAGVSDQSQASCHTPLDYGVHLRSCGAPDRRAVAARRKRSAGRTYKPL